MEASRRLFCGMREAEVRRKREVGRARRRGRSIGRDPPHPLIPSHVPDHVGRRAAVEVLPDGVVVHGRGQRHKHVPDGVGEGDDAVAFEEKHAQTVDQPPPRQLLETVCVVLGKIGENV